MGVRLFPGGMGEDDAGVEEGEGTGVCVGEGASEEGEGMGVGVGKGASKVIGVGSGIDVGVVEHPAIRTIVAIIITRGRSPRRHVFHLTVIFFTKRQNCIMGYCTVWALR